MTAPALSSTVTVPGVAAKIAKEPFVYGALIAPLTVVQLSLPAGPCQVPLPPATTPSFLGPLPSQKLTVSPAVLTRLNCPATEVWTKSVLPAGSEPRARPLLVND